MEKISEFPKSISLKCMHFILPRSQGIIFPYVLFTLQSYYHLSLLICKQREEYDYDDIKVLFVRDHANIGNCHQIFTRY